MDAGLDVAALEMSVRCEVCMAAFAPGRTRLLPDCGHTFCRECLESLFRLSQRGALTPKCPSCRASVHVALERLPRNYALESVAVLLAPLLCLMGAPDPEPPAARVDGRNPIELPSIAHPAAGQQPAAAADPPAAAELVSGDVDLARVTADVRAALLARRAAAAADAAARAARARAAASSAPRALPAGEVEAAILDFVLAAGRPVPLVGVANHLADRRLWPPAQLAALQQQQQQQQQQRHPHHPARVATTFGGAPPSPALIKAFLASRAALSLDPSAACTPREPARVVVLSAGGDSSAPPPTTATATTPPPVLLHLEVGRASLAECLCPGGPLCQRGRDALSQRRQLAAAAAAPYVPPSLRDPDGGRVASARLGSAPSRHRDAASDEAAYYDSLADAYDPSGGQLRLSQGRGKGRRW